MLERIIVIVHYKNRNSARYDIQDDSFQIPSGGGFQQIGRAIETGQPIVVNADEVLSLGPEEDLPMPSIG